jgi:hypothetical protein
MGGAGTNKFVRHISSSYRALMLVFCASPVQHPIKSHFFGPACCTRNWCRRASTGDDWPKWSGKGPTERSKQVSKLVWETRGATYCRRPCKSLYINV